MESFWENFISNTAIIGLLIAAGTFVLKGFVNNLFSHEIERYKTELLKDQDKYRITYEKLHLERAEVISEIYRKIVLVERNFEIMMSPLQRFSEDQKMENRMRAIDSAKDFIDYFDQNRIFFEESLVKKLEEVEDLFWDSWSDWMLSQDLRLDNMKDARKKESDAWDKLKNKFPSIKKGVEDKFREIIGIKL